MTEPKNPAADQETDANVLSEEELEAANGGVLTVVGQNLGNKQLKTALSSQEVIAPVDVKAGNVPSVKDTLL